MPKLKVLSGGDVIRVFESFSFAIVARKGSHVKLQRITEHRTKQTLTVPNHPEIDKGTLKAIYNQALRYISESELRAYFYSD